MKHILLLIVIISKLTYANCSENVDNTNIHYINGMFTNKESYNKNISELEFFSHNNLYNWNFTFDINSNGSWNQSESFLIQFKQVALQKFTELNVNKAVQENISNTFSGFDTAPTSQQSAQETTDVMSAILEEIHDTYYQDQTFQHAYSSVTKLLDECKRVVLIGHSQGNFYTNALLDNLYSSYQYPDGSTLHDYRMLGYFGFALPTSSVGGYTGDQYPHLMGFITNDNDLIMAAIRYTIGALPSNYDNDFSLSDFTGHSLIVSYLHKLGQSNIAATNIRNIISQLYPPPIADKNITYSSAMISYGYSKLSQVLDIKFFDSSVYRYLNVPYKEFELFVNSKSKGSFFNSSIKNIYPYVKIK
ncbi:KTSC domain-containing protein [Vibrio sp. S11_S32]|uniref:KTSC domain-containing protein n=1 Tax=Vibrio sp. S11_S32 TaxID=2720225 RepID=UPI001680139B|nr:KTSC domain-containing protein [Vibrio sp. S11_S32]MBD1576421.1 KTSC domain-containing protein [Vibrio sp. S11_S32]